MTLKTYARKWLAVLLAVAVLLPALAVYLPVTAEEAENYGLQTYDSFEAKKYGVVNGSTGIAGNGEGRVVSADYDHTTGSGNSIKLEMAGYKTTQFTPQTVALGADGTRVKLTKGKTYTVSVWLYSETAISLKYRLASIADANDPTWGKRQNEKEVLMDLAAGEWKQVMVEVTPTGIAGQDTAYLTIGVTYADSSVKTTGYVYLDDVWVREVDLSASDCQTYEAYEAKKHGVVNGTTGIAGNGEGRVVSADYNHTTGGAHSIKLEMAGYKTTQYTPQTVALGADGTRLLLTKGKTYAVSAWLYSETAVSLKYRLSSIADANDPTWGKRQNEKEVLVNLAAGEWKQVTVDVTLAGIAGQETAYLTIGATYADSSVTTTGYVYLDDVSVAETTPPPAFAYGKQDYESYEVKTYEAGSAGIHGNGSGREVTAEQNHTPGGQKSIKLNVNNSQIDYYARTVLPLDGTDFQVRRGDCYTVSFWLYSGTERKVTWYVGSTVSVADLYAGKNNTEQQGTVSLPAGEWTQVTANVNVTGHHSSDTAYLTIGARFDGCETSPDFLYLDDVELVVPDDLVTVTFHAEGGSAVESRKTFAGDPLGYLAPSTRAGYLFAGWYGVDGSTLYTADTIPPADVTALNLYAEWVQVPDVAQSLATGFEESDYTAVPYANDDPATAVLRSNMTASATWMKDAGFSAETGDGAMRLVNDPFVQETSNAYQAFALMNADGTPFVVKGGAKYRITYSYRGDERSSAHSYVSAYVSADAAFTGVGTGDQQLTRDVIHGIELDWQQVEECFLAEEDGYVYFTFCARSSTSDNSSRGHAVYIDNVTVEVLDDTYSVVTFQCNDTVINRVGKTGSPLHYPGFYVENAKELEGWYTDTAYTQKFTADVYPAQDTTLYARIVSGDYDTDIVYVEDGLTLDFEDDSLPTFYSAKNHMTYGNDYVDFVTGDADEARSGDSYMRLNPISYDYSASYFMLYNPDAPHGLLYLKPNSSYRVSFYVKLEDDFLPFNAMLCLGDPSGIGKDLQNTYIVSVNGSAGEWVLAETIVVTGDEPAVLSVNPSLSSGAGGTPLTLLDDFTILKLYDVTVAFESNGGNRVEPVVIPLGSVIEQPTAPYRRGYEFVGWYTDKELQNAFDFTTPIMGDMTLYAEWREIATDSGDEGSDTATDSTGKTEGSGTDTPSAPVDTPVTEPMMDTGDRPTVDLTETAPVDAPADDPTAPTPEGTFSVQMLLIIIAIVVVLVGGGALTVLLRKKKKTNEEEG